QKRFVTQFRCHHGRVFLLHRIPYHSPHNVEPYPWGFALLQKPYTITFASHPLFQTMRGTSMSADFDLLNDLLVKARRKGADAADAVLVDAVSLSVTWRLGTLEQLERSEGSDIGLRVLIGRRQAIVSSSERTPAALEELAERAMAMARAVPEDPFCGLADSADLIREIPDLDICDLHEPSAEQLTFMVRAAEEAGRAVPGITNSHGASAGWGRRAVALVGSNGFAARYAVSHTGLSVSLLAGDEAHGMESDYDQTTAVHGADLRVPEEVGRTAAARTLKRCGARKAMTTQVPVVYDPREACSLVSHFLSAINGASVARGTTFLKDRLHQPVFAEGMGIIDDPLRRRGLRSKPCDAEGLPTRRSVLVENGVLQSWLLDQRSARQLGLASTGHASRGPSSPPAPAPTNAYLVPGALDPVALMADIREGFYVTELFGMGVNGVTGDYSCGATGFWIENGQRTYPVHEVTVAGNLKDMFRTLTVANDLEFRHGIDSPTVRIEGMTVAGQ
ncbi:MAG: PmbA protein, partial [Rhodospirillaceae bacterium]